MVSSGKIFINKTSSKCTAIFNILDNATELWMTKYIIGEIFSSGGATLYKNPSDQNCERHTYQMREQFGNAHWRKPVDPCQ